MLPIIKDNYVFKKMFGSKGSEHITMSFLQSFLDIPEDEYDSINFVDSDPGIVALKLKTTRGKTINVRMQIIPNEEAYNEVFLELNNMIINQSLSPEKLIVIMILDYIMYPDDNELSHRGTLFDRMNNHSYQDNIEIYTLEPGKTRDLSF
ncbi:MAG: Rpn family recombination-promoting nuclease/putative transposase [Oscillospiraceae bacterium]|nr:Rpn family recombination-promoting nuclease/putative transposase [Oscillospiraceae bacterium]